ncbi:TetR family transcriptional regulator C-terminal domain-containing protein [Gymnodinialimonas sp. 2305UL16-5]|uniref:TetR/AcrR family transcriptional regulator n=1 Tax=Gymnodinialimonas mytili TaxID=3126503 RepID=UPI0030B7B5BC
MNLTRMSGAERRRQIIHAAYEVILDKGLSEAATRDVTRRMDVSPGLLHHYFPSWGQLRAEAVRTFVMAEIEEIDGLLATTEAYELVACFTDWMAKDPAFRHWGLWLDAIDAARRDPDLAAVVTTAYGAWHSVIASIIERRVAAGRGSCPNVEAAAWRIGALIDGLAGVVALGDVALDAEQAKGLVRQQFDLELCADVSAA